MTQPEPTPIVTPTLLEQQQGGEQVRLGASPQQHVQQDRHRGQTESVNDGGVDQLHQVTSPAGKSASSLTAKTPLQTTQTGHSALAIASSTASRIPELTLNPLPPSTTARPSRVRK